MALDMIDKMVKHMVKMAVEGSFNPENTDKSQCKKPPCSNALPQRCSINHKLQFYNRNSTENLYSYLVTIHRPQI